MTVQKIMAHNNAQLGICTPIQKRGKEEEMPNGKLGQRHFPQKLHEEAAVSLPLLCCVKKCFYFFAFTRYNSAAAAVEEQNYPFSCPERKAIITHKQPLHISIGLCCNKKSNVLLI